MLTAIATVAVGCGGSTDPVPSVPKASTPPPAGDGKDKAKGGISTSGPAKPSTEPVKD